MDESTRFCYHIDDVLDNLFVGNILSYNNKSLGEVFTDAVESMKEANSDYTLMFASMIKSVIYVACARVIDEKRTVAAGSGAPEDESTNKRAIRRVDMILEMIKGTPGFVAGVVKHLARLQTEREKILQVPQVSKNWIFNEVTLSLGKALNI